MKKLFLVISIALMMMTSACQKEVVKVNESELESYTVDMSGYDGMNSVKHNFKGITPENLLKAIENDESAVFYIGYTNCPVCQDLVKHINKAAEELNLTVYYLDCYNDLYPLLDYESEILEKLDSILRKDKDGNPGIYTPHLFTVVDGEFMDSQIGFKDYDNSEESVTKVINRYKEIMKYFN